MGTLSYSWETHTRLGGLRVSRIFGTRGNVAFGSNGLGRRALRDFVGTIRQDREGRCSLAHARRAVELVEAAVSTSREAPHAVDGSPTGRSRNAPLSMQETRRQRFRVLRRQP